MADRGLRLAQEKRVKDKVKRFVTESWSMVEDNSQILSPKSIGRMAHAPQSCSGRCCGNPRKHEKGKWKLTMQEMRKLQEEE